MTINSQEASAALDDIESITRRVRQSLIYRQAGIIAILWGGLTFAANVAAFVWPRNAGIIWPLVDGAGLAGTIAIQIFYRANTPGRRFDPRFLAAFVLIAGFGLLWTRGFGPPPARMLNAFWTSYFMLFYSLAGLWFGAAFVTIGLGVTALTVLGYYLGGAWYDLWMAAVNGGGLILGGLWMQRR